MSLHRRDLAWDGCLDLRDLGGHRTGDGRETRYGAVVTDEELEPACARLR
jgi:protein-tyrosine phosphatase